MNCPCFAKCNPIEDEEEKNKCETNCDKECQISDMNKDEFIAEYQLETVEDEEEGDEEHLLMIWEGKAFEVEVKF